MAAPERAARFMRNGGRGRLCQDALRTEGKLQTEMYATVEPEVIEGRINFRF